MTAARKAAPKRPAVRPLDTRPRQESNSQRFDHIPPNVRSFIDWLVEQAFQHRNDP